MLSYKNFKGFLLQQLGLFTLQFPKEFLDMCTKICTTDISTVTVMLLM